MARLQSLELETRGEELERAVGLHPLPMHEGVVGLLHEPVHVVLHPLHPLGNGALGELHAPVGIKARHGVLGQIPEAIPPQRTAFREREEGLGPIIPLRGQ
jgi:hypothetical protein